MLTAFLGKTSSRSSRSWISHNSQRNKTFPSLTESAMDNSYDTDNKKNTSKDHPPNDNDTTNPPNNTNPDDDSTVVCNNCYCDNKDYDDDDDAMYLVNNWKN